MRQVSAVHYEDLYPKSFVAFRKKYLPLLKKGGGHRNYYVQFTNFMDDTLSKKPYENPDHHDPVAIYGYPLEYVLKHPADIWYGNQAKYLRVLTERKSNNTLLLQYMTESGAANVLYKMGLPYDSMDKARLLWPARIGKGTGSIGRAFFQAMQMDMSGVGKIPRSKDKRKALADSCKVRSGKEQTALLRKAGFDAIEDTARNQKTAVINPREPEQIAFLHRNSFDVVEVIPLKLSQQKTGVGTSQDPSYLAPKLAALIATRIGDRIVDKDDYNRTFWTAAGREITVKFEYHPSYYEGKKMGEKKHKEAELSNPHLIDVTLISERGTLSPRLARDEKFVDVADDIAERFNSAEPVEGFQPISKASRAAEEEAATKAYRQKEKEKKYEELKRWVPYYLSEIAEVAQRLGLPFTQAEYFNSSDETRMLLNNILMLVGRYLSNGMHRVEKLLHEEDPNAWDWYSKYDREKAIKEIKQAIDHVAEDSDASPTLIKEMVDIYEASLNWMLDHRAWRYQIPTTFFSFLLQYMKESEPEALTAASKLVAEAAALLSGGKVSGYLVNDVIQLKDYLLMDDAGKGYEIAWNAWPMFVGWAEDTQPEGIDVDGLNANDAHDAETNIDNIPQALFAAFWEWFNVIENTEDLSKYVPPAEQPTFLFMEFERIIKGEWLVHFSDKAGSIATNGFKHGVFDVTRLGLTTHFINKPHPGFNFAYLAKDAARWGSARSRSGWKYGKHAVMFKANGVKVYHHADQEPQVIFLGSTAKDIVELENTDDGWVVVGKNGPVFKSGDLGSSKEGLQRCVDWVETNYDQYRNKLNQRVVEKPKRKLAATG